jgi:hypothetical protein
MDRFYDTTKEKSNVTCVEQPSTQRAQKSSDEWAEISLQANFLAWWSRNSPRAPGGVSFPFLPCLCFGKKQACGVFFLVFEKGERNVRDLPEQGRGSSKSRFVVRALAGFDGRTQTRQTGPACQGLLMRGPIGFLRELIVLLPAQQQWQESQVKCSEVEVPGWQLGQ